MSSDEESRFFLDTADINEWDRFLPTGIFYGITTNPTILEKDGHECTIPSLRKLAEKALSSGQCQEFMCQTWGKTPEEMFENGMALSKMLDDSNNDNSISSSSDENPIVVKVPVTKDGAEAATMLIANGVRICLTACYASHQAFIAAQIGAEYIAPYLGRMCDAGKNGIEEIKTMQKIVDNLKNGKHKRRTRIFVASIRDVESMVELTANGGLDTFTFSPGIAQEIFFKEPLTIKATSDFEDAAERNGAVNLVA
eukprot:CAMPEP_0178972526 /NCGR_PEP_ID=MMETSP0789-20121207/21075_1 /TAXON_ID=3005 /ORGANISM="Rhizosolenia setigera, Strain CCMP 1694" /LENGTH=253 /DNA_ID=CAMNT_0020660009 /DNA_START=327 /DNA_END=1088 /DNA_ORIENTATION=-